MSHMNIVFMQKNFISIISVIYMAFAHTFHANSQGDYNGIVNPFVTYSYEKMTFDLNALTQRYPMILTGEKIGYSLERRTIPAVRFGRGQHRILICATLHAREHIATNYIMYFIEQYAEAYASHDSIGGYDVNHLLDNVTLYIVPMVNPDGVNIVQRGFEASCNCDSLRKMKLKNYEEPAHRSWKANARGVDINRNFDFGWYDSPTDSLPASMSFKGFSPISEPESKALADYAKRIKPEAVLAFHTQGEQFFFSTPDAKACEIATKLVESTGFEPQPIDPPYGSFQDFVNLHFGVFYACVELCPYIGPRPYPEKDFFTVWQPAQYVIPIVATEIINQDNSK